MLKLPKDVVDHPKSGALSAYLSANPKDLWSGKQAGVVALDDTLRAAFAPPEVRHHLVQGLESVGKLLDREKKGLDQVRAQKNEPVVARLSRLLFLSSDGSERFYHDAASLMGRHTERLVTVVIDATSDELGKMLAEQGNPAKAFMIADRKALGEFLKIVANSL